MTTLHISTDTSLYTLEVLPASLGSGIVDLQDIGDFGASVLDIGFDGRGDLFALGRSGDALFEVDRGDASLTDTGLRVAGDHNGLGQGLNADLALSDADSGAVVELDLAGGRAFDFIRAHGDGSAGDVTLHERGMALAEQDGRNGGLIGFYGADGALDSSVETRDAYRGLASLGENNLLGATGQSIVLIDDETGDARTVFDLSRAIDGEITGLAFGGPRINDILTGAQGSDRINGGIGDDLITGAQGKDVLFGARGDDVLSGDQGKDLLRGNGGDDMLFGDNGKDRLAGGGGSDYLEGGNGKDLIDGGFGDDYLVGGKGPDRFVFHGRPGDDVIADWNDGPDRMVLDLRGVDRFADLDLDQTRDGLMVSGDHFSVLLLDANEADFGARDVIFL